VHSAATSSHAAFTVSPLESASHPKLAAPNAETSDQMTILPILSIALFFTCAMKLRMG
jgi:hypothetical protein